MAGMLPGVELARRRRTHHHHESSSREPCLFRSSSRLEPTTALGEAALRARTRLEQKLRGGSDSRQQDPPSHLDPFYFLPKSPIQDPAALIIWELRWATFIRCLPTHQSFFFFWHLFYVCFIGSDCGTRLDAWTIRQKKKKKGPVQIARDLAYQTDWAVSTIDQACLCRLTIRSDKQTNGSVAFQKQFGLEGF